MNRVDRNSSENTLIALAVSSDCSGGIVGSLSRNNVWTK